MCLVLVSIAVMAFNLAKKSRLAVKDTSSRSTRLSSTTPMHRMHPRPPLYESDCMDDMLFDCCLVRSRVLLAAQRDKDKAMRHEARESSHAHHRDSHHRDHDHSSHRTREDCRDREEGGRHSSDKYGSSHRPSSHHSDRSHSSHHDRDRR